MYRRKNKRYDNKSHTDLPMVDDNTYNLFNSVRYGNKTTLQFKEDLEKLMSTNNISVENILYQGNNLLVYSAIFENEAIFQFLIENFKSNLESSLPQCIYYLYPNKNPQILKIALNAQGIPDENFKHQLGTSVTQHCFRQENIQILKVWFEKYFNETEISEITKQLIHNNNKPFLKEVCYDSFWKKQVSQLIPEFQEVITSKMENYFFHIITGSDHQAPNKDESSVSNYNISLITNQSGQHGEFTPKKTPTENKKHPKLSDSFTLSKEKIGLKENHPPVIIRKRKLSIS